MCRTNDGFEIAEVDLTLRGPGNIEGTQQSGTVNLRLAELGKDQIILTAARQDALNILENDPELISNENVPLKNFFNIRKNKQEKPWEKIS